MTRFILAAVFLLLSGGQLQAQTESFYRGKTIMIVAGLRESYMKTRAHPEFLAEAKKRAWEVSPASAEALPRKPKK